MRKYTNFNGNIKYQVLALGFGVSCIGLAFVADWLGTGVLQVDMIMMIMMTTTVMVLSKSR